MCISLSPTLALFLTRLSVFFLKIPPFSSQLHLALVASTIIFKLKHCFNRKTTERRHSLSSSGRTGVSGHSGVSVFPKGHTRPNGSNSSKQLQQRLSGLSRVGEIGTGQSLPRSYHDTARETRKQWSADECRSSTPRSSGRCTGAKPTTDTLGCGWSKTPIYNWLTVGVRVGV